MYDAARITQTRSYSRAEFLSDAVVHVVGLALAIGAIPVLILLAATVEPSVPKVAGVSVYAVSMLAMLGFSALYNLVSSPEWAWLLARLDHSAIFLKIAGTYTPFALLSGQGLPMLAGLWGAAATGVLLKIASPFRFRRVALALYLGMGWIGVLAGWAIFAALPLPVTVLAAIGGVLYTAGVIFHVRADWPFHNTIWHVFVLAATLIFYTAILLAVLTV